MNALGPSVPIWRVLTGFVVAPAAAAFVLAWFQPLYAGLPGPLDRLYRTFWIYLLIGGYPPVLILGLPAYFLLRRWLRPTLLNCGLVGAVVAVVPWSILGLFSVSDYSFDGGRVTAEHGHRTLAGWQDFAASMGWMALLGLFTGIVFWIVATAGINPSKSPVQVALPQDR